MTKYEEIAAGISAKRFAPLKETSLEAEGAALVATHLPEDQEVYRALLLGTATNPRRFYDWNIGFLVPHLNGHILASLLADNENALLGSEGISWGLGEAGNDDKRIVNFLFRVCEERRDADAWWCAADALEKLGAIEDATDLKKRTLSGTEWEDLDYCLSELRDRAAVIALLRLARADNTESVIIPAARALLENSDDRKILQNSVWLLERLKVDDDDTLDSLISLYDRSEDISDSLRPRIVEAFGELATPRLRHLLEAEVSKARYYRTRAYAARGLGRIGEARSLEVLRSALRSEEDERVSSYLTNAIYAIQSDSQRARRLLSRSARWPENGMISDESNRWYANPEIYDRFADAEDPLNVGFDLALSYLGSDVRRVVDLGSGTGRLAIRLAENRPEVETIHALELNSEMFKFLKSKLLLRRGLVSINPVQGSIDSIPLPDESVDAVISSWAFPSRMWEPEVCLKELMEVHRVLRPSGALITIGWDETFRDELSELWYRFVPEPNFRRERFEAWRSRRRARVRSPRNCHLTFVKRNLEVPLLFARSEDSAFVLGHLFGYSAGKWIAGQQRCEFSIRVGITVDDFVSIQD